MGSRRCATARSTVRDALDFTPGGPTPQHALRELVESIAEAFHDGAPAPAILSLVAERDGDFEALLLLVTGITLDGRAPHVPGAEAALQHHERDCARVLATNAPAPWSAVLSRHVDLHALARHRGARRAAFRALVKQRPAAFAATFTRCTGIEL